MKNNAAFLILLWLGGCLALTSCSSKNLLTLSVNEPAPVFIPSTIKTIGIIDRSLPVDKNKKLDNLDKILSIEGKNLDKDGAREATRALFNELHQNSKFLEIKDLSDLDVRSPGLGVFPSALSWETIEAICNENQIDAVFALSFYDTDSKIDYQSVPIEIKGPLGVKIPAVEHHATLSTLIKTGWRIYDPKNRFIRDEFIINDEVVLVGKGINPLKAVEAIMGRKEAVLHASNRIGQNYALRILPYKTRVSRYYYVRGTNNFEIGKRRARTGDWDGAAELWKKDIEHHKTKIAGRACYNMAIINEINGNLETAIDWASKSYTDYKNKLALRYVNILKHRVKRNEELQHQLEQ